MKLIFCRRASSLTFPTKTRCSQSTLPRQTPIADIATLDRSPFQLSVATRKAFLRASLFVTLRYIPIKQDPGHHILRIIQETVDFGSPRDELVDNIWVPEEKLPGFRKFMEEFYETCFKLELEILAALAKALGVDEKQMVTLHNKAENEFRILHYPEVPASELADGTATRIAEHTDFGSITMLFQDSVGGLQVEDQQNPGVFRGIESADKTEIILNIGDSMQRLTNDTFRAACHRVTYPPSIKTGVEAVIPERFSIAYFAKPNRTASLFPFKEFITASTPCRYDDMNAWDYQNLRISRLFK